MSIQTEKPRVSTAEEAEWLVTLALEALDALQPIVDEETRQLKEGFVHEALTLGELKGEAASRYLFLIDALKANAITLGRFQPNGLELLKRRHQMFSDTLSLNAAVLSTARSVSESVIREVSSHVAGSINPQGYGARGTATSPYTSKGAPIAVSKTL
jgi:hypothetical protein